MKSVQRKRLGREDGVALLLAIFMVTLLTASVFEVHRMIREDVDAVLISEERAQALQNAHTGLDGAIFVLLYDREEDNRNNNRQPLDYWLDPEGLADLLNAAELWSLFAVGNDAAQAVLGMEGGMFPLEGGAFAFKIEDLESRFPLNRLFIKRGIDERNPNYKNFVHFLEELGVEEAQARTVMESLADWIDPDSELRGLGQESDGYTGLQQAYMGRNQMMLLPDEFRAVNGVDDVIYGTIAKFVTVYPNHHNLFSQYTINVNTAPMEVLRGLDYEIDTAAAETIVSTRQDGPYRTIGALSQVVNGQLNLRQAWGRIQQNAMAAVSTQTFRVISSGFAGQSEVVLETILRREFDKGRASYKILWQQVY